VKKSDEEQMPDENKDSESFWKSYVKEFIFSKNAWIPESIFTSVVLGVILGLSSFWNGAVVIAALFSAFCYGCFLETQTSVSDYGVNYCRVGLLPDSIFL